ncbi:pilus assembly protein PilP [Pseudomonas mucidolens]|uniref:Type IV pilus assembly protein PilO/type IV pilus assembly protein PilP n=1 Tax=Pseudomonas mucidolens TaxID=46679 RepID=A0A1H2NN01_9PSED|nr:pilus assembly protein PilP [Pseudomonas mucidolens]SDV06832.1 type IV pilus assembly protein PilO/type IV pilus assembly protein PilP [Pseudomonas mucidolens]SQH31496.1 type IV pilus biogenesis protein PilOP [Pseudomonas mucidolens]
MSGLDAACLGLALIFLAGCENHADLQALKDQLQVIRQQVPVPSAEAPLAAAPGRRFVYDPVSLRDPFQPPHKPLGRPAGRPGRAPDPGRPRQFLEGFAVDDFQMVGTLTFGARVFALLRGTVGVHRLEVGDYLGGDHGRVVAIHEGQVDIVELFPDGQGEWLERSRTLVLNVNS